MKVIAMGRVSVYPRDGAYQLYCQELMQDGRGALDGPPVARGDHLLLPAGYGTMTLEGRLELICSHL